jgi:cardiolipin synthase A/B
LAYPKQFSELAALLARYEGAANLTRFADALESATLTEDPRSVDIQSTLGIPLSRARAYIDVVQAAPDRQTLIITLRSVAHTAEQFLKMRSNVELAWTFPGHSSPGLRTTGAVANDIIKNARAMLLIVGYSVSSDQASGLASKTITNIVQAAQRGVSITAVFHRRVNRDAFLSRWREGIPVPKIFTWSMQDDALAGIHAKILVADRHDALVTSANLTFHGFERNIEMGVRVSGDPAAQLDDRFVEMIRTKQLVAY